MELYCNLKFRVIGEALTVDPRSMMQGDYMRLRYHVENAVRTNSDELLDKTGFLILNVANDKIATFAKIDNGEALSNQQIRFKFSSSGYRPQISPDSFLFQQGLRKLYQPAKYGMFKVVGNEHLLTGLADGDLNEIKPPKAVANN